MGLPVGIVYIRLTEVRRLTLIVGEAIPRDGSQTG